MTAAESPFRLSAEEWTQDVAPLIRQKVAERVAGIVATGDAKKKAATIDAAANAAARIVTRHREDWETHHTTFSVGGIAANFELGKSAKISSEMLAIRQKAERIAWNLEDKASDEIVITNPRRAESE